MLRALVILATVAAALSAGAAPVPTHLMSKAPPVYHARTPGTRFVWDHKYSWTAPEETTVIITAADEQREGHLVTLDFIAGQREPAALQKLSASDRGLALVEYGGCKVDPPLWLLKLPIRPGEQWESTTSVQDEEQKFRHTVGKPEWVEVPAGRFHAVPVVQELLWAASDGDTEFKRPPETNWYAPGVGCVKTTITTSRTSVLRSVTHDKK
ncbi:hypothetical protein R5W23_003031 [Gemmata sp. JC673]|uniref:Uncharacterized protein n=1 Tax=Gemmata algarum TaxID=2975278 RepID=A0ABU5EQZ7_9BACT|nr:hypothetical protein [Gemmata algarum]MDY3557766.1 hypothetical protein [Gemmata algarum]